IEKSGQPADRHSALWVEKSGDDDARMYVGATADEQKEAQGQFEEAKLIPRTLHATSGVDGRTRYCGVWGRPSRAGIEGRTLREQFEKDFEQTRADLSDQSLIDVAVSGASEPPTARAGVQGNGDADLRKVEKDATLDPAPEGPVLTETRK